MPAGLLAYEVGVLPAGLLFAQPVEGGARVLGLAALVGDVRTLGDVLPYRVREGDDQGAHHQRQQGGAAGEAVAAGRPGSVDAGGGLLAERLESGRGREPVRGHVVSPSLTDA